jgi:hypothetical protein
MYQMRAPSRFAVPRIKPWASFIRSFVAVLEAKYAYYVSNTVLHVIEYPNFVMKNEQCCKVG